MRKNVKKPEKLPLKTHFLQYLMVSIITFISVVFQYL